MQVLPHGSVAVDGGTIVAVGPTQDLDNRYVGRETITATGRLVSPGLIDPHTHLVHGGTRHVEWEAAVLGIEPDSSIERGVSVSRRATGALTTAELTEGITRRLDVMLAHGTTTAEVKSGYGETARDEVRLLEAVGRARHSLTVVPTYLGAHVSPGRERHAAFVDEVIDTMAAARPLAEFCDVCCDPTGFTVAECLRIATAASDHGFGLRVHADQTGPLAGAEFAAEAGAFSADHLEYVSDRGISALAGAATAAIILPTVSYHTFSLVKQPSASGWTNAPQPWLAERFRSLVDAGALVALATDYNPGSSPNLSMQTAMQAAARLYRLSYAEIWHAATINAAASLGRADRIGSIAPGKRADLVVWSVPSHELVINQFGTNLVDSVITAGHLAHSSSSPVSSTRSQAIPSLLYK